MALELGNWGVGCFSKRGSERFGATGTSVNPGNKKSPKKCITKENQFFSKFSMGGSLGQKRGFERRALL